MPATQPPPPSHRTRAVCCSIPNNNTTNDDYTTTRLRDAYYNNALTFSSPVHTHTHTKLPSYRRKSAYKQTKEVRPHFFYIFATQRTRSNGGVLAASQPPSYDAPDACVHDYNIYASFSPIRTSGQIPVYTAVTGCCCCLAAKQTEHKMKNIYAPLCSVGL